MESAQHLIYKIIVHLKNGVELHSKTSITSTEGYNTLLKLLDNVGGGGNHTLRIETIKGMTYILVSSILYVEVVQISDGNTTAL